MESTQVKHGYKVTELGVIPEDWAIKELQENSSIIDSLHKTPKFSSSGYPMVRVSDVKTGLLNLKNCSLVSEDVYHDFTSNYKPTIGDIILSRVGSYGVSSYVSTPAPFCLGQNTVVINTRTFSKYIYYCLNSQYIKSQIEDLSYGTGYKSLSLANIKKLKLLFPPPLEQKAIAAALSDVDALITAQEALIAKKRDIKTATMQQLLTGKVRLGEFGQQAGANGGQNKDGVPPGYQQTELGVLPDDWEIYKISDLIDNRSIVDHLDGNHGSLYPKSHEFVDFGVPYIAANNFLHGKVDFSNCKYLTTERAKQFKKGISKDGDVLFAHNATVGPVALLNYPGEYAILSTTATYFRCDIKKLSNEYLRYYFESQSFINQYSAVMSQSTRNQVPISAQRKFKVILPPLSEQNLIAEILSNMDAEITALEAQRDKTRAIKQGMMQELLTGKTRLVDSIS